jgi:Zn-dependent protease/CBS domain-containing protein
MKIGKIFGIDIIIHISWIFVFALVAWMLGSDIGPLQHLEVTPESRVGLGILAAILFFASVLIHELAHSVVARSRGIPVSSITLFIFGGVSSLEAEPKNPGVEGWVAFVGPLASLVLALLFSVISQAFGANNPFGAIAQYLAFANAALAVFNLLPALPLDGGRVFHSIVWRKTKDRLRATRIAALVGRIIAGAIIAVGIAESLYIGFGYGLWLIFIGWFILQAGSGELAQAEALASLQGMTAADVAAPITLAIPSDNTSSAAFESLLKFGQSSAPVVQDGRLIGLVSLYDIGKIESDRRQNIPVTSVMTRAADVQTVPPETAASDVLKLFGKSGHRQIPVVDASGKLIALVTRDGILQRIAVASGKVAAT